MLLISTMSTGRVLKIDEQQTVPVQHWPPAAPLVAVKHVLKLPVASAAQHSAHGAAEPPGRKLSSAALGGADHQSTSHGLL